MFASRVVAEPPTVAASPPLPPYHRIFLRHLPFHDPVDVPATLYSCAALDHHAPTSSPCTSSSSSTPDISEPPPHDSPRIPSDPRMPPDVSSPWPSPPLIAPTQRLTFATSPPAGDGVRTTAAEKVAYYGVRKRHWGRWVSEIREPKKKRRIWLGSFAEAEMAARAYDVAARCLRGSAARLNFPHLAAFLPSPASAAPEDIQAAAQAAAHFSGGSVNMSSHCATANVDPPTTSDHDPPSSPSVHNAGIEESAANANAIGYDSSNSSIGGGGIRLQEVPSSLPAEGAADHRRLQVATEEEMGGGGEYWRMWEDWEAMKGARGGDNDQSEEENEEEEDCSCSYSSEHSGGGGGGGGATIGYSCSYGAAAGGSVCDTPLDGTFVLGAGSADEYDNISLQLPYIAYDDDLDSSQLLFISLWD